LTRLQFHPILSYKIIGKNEKHGYVTALREELMAVLRKAEDTVRCCRRRPWAKGLPPALEPLLRLHAPIGWLRGAR
jgi:hypothetical protein